MADHGALSFVDAILFAIAGDAHPHTTSRRQADAKRLYMQLLVEALGENRASFACTLNPTRRTGENEVGPVV